MKPWRMLGCLAVVTLLAVVAGNARADSQTYTFDVSVVDPANNVTGLIFLYTQGDVVREQLLNASALAGKTSTFAISEDIDLTIPGTPSFSIVGLYGPAANQGVYVAVNNAQAANFVAAGTAFDNAFPSFAANTALIAPGVSPEAALVDGIQNPLTDESAFLFAESSESDAVDPFTAINLNGSTKASFLGFSTAALDGSVEVDVVPPGGSGGTGGGTPGVPEPSSGSLAALILLACGLAHGATRAFGANGARTNNARAEIAPPSSTLQAS
jgi:hypothetical protein